MQFNTDSIKNGDKILENTWETIYKISKELEQTHEQNIAAQKILLLNPNNETINQEDASLSQTFINLNAEISQILEALQDQIMDIDLWKQLFYKYILIRNYPEAKKAAMNIIQIDQNLNDPIFFYCLGSISANLNLNLNSNEQFGIEQEGDVFKYFEKGKENNPDCLFRYAIFLRRCSYFQESLSLFNRIRENIPYNLTEDDIYFQIAFTSQFLCDETLKQNSIQIFEDLLQNYPTNQTVIRQYIWFCSEQNDESLYNNVISLLDNNPHLKKDPSITFALGQLEMNSNKPNHNQKAYQYFSSLLQIYDNSPSLWMNLAKIYFENKQYSDAIRSIENALAFKNDIPEFWLNLGLIYEIQSNIKSAQSIYEKALQLCPKNELILGRYNSLNLPTRTQKDKSLLSSEYLNIDCKQFFEYPAEKVATQYLEDLPFIPDEILKIDEAYSKIILHHNSLFE